MHSTIKYPVYDMRTQSPPHNDENGVGEYRNRGMTGDEVDIGESLNNGATRGWNRIESTKTEEPQQTSFINEEAMYDNSTFRGKQ